MDFIKEKMRDVFIKLPCGSDGGTSCATCFYNWDFNYICDSETFCLRDNHFCDE